MSFLVLIARFIDGASRVGPGSRWNARDRKFGGSRPAPRLRCPYVRISGGGGVAAESRGLPCPSCATCCPTHDPARISEKRDPFSGCVKAARFRSLRIMIVDGVSSAALLLVLAARLAARDALYVPDRIDELRPMTRRCRA